MSIPITPALVEAVYEMLLQTPPFNRWKLPHVDSIQIVITSSKVYAGTVAIEHDGSRTLMVSGALHSTLASLLVTVSHEMIHVYEAVKGLRNDVKHGKFFQRAADSVCKHHKFDRKCF